MEQLGQQVAALRFVPQAKPSGVPPSPPARSDITWPTELLVLQPTPFCNIDCSYCYLPQRNARHRMSLQTVRLAVRRLREDALLGDEITVVWHAGEPLVLPPSWYEDAFAVVRDELGPGTRCTHAMQTNATLIDAAWCAFFRRHAVQVGVSLDGPAALHDRHRRTRRGAGTHAAVMRGVRLLQAHGVPFHAIAVVTADTLADAAGFYAFFAEAGIRELGCNIDEAEGSHTRSSHEGHEAAHEAFVQQLLANARDGRVAVRELGAAWQLLQRPLPSWRWRGGVPWPVNTQCMPLALITVGWDGRFGTFSPELLGQRAPAFDHFVLGDVHLHGYVHAVRQPAFARLWAGIGAGIEACRRECAHFAVCGGGAPANKFYEHGRFDATATLYCRSSLQRPLNAVLAQAERALGLAA